jgi:hypothetical protein
VELDLRKAFYSNAESPHDFAVANYENSLVGALPAESVECMINTYAYIGNALASRRSPEKSRKEIKCNQIWI